MEQKSSGSQKTVPSSITVNVRPRMAVEDIKSRKRSDIPKGLLAALIALGSLLVVGVIVVGVLLITQPEPAAAVDIKPAATQTAEPTATPEPTEKPTPIPTTAPEQSDDFSSIFEAPTNPILDEETQN